MKPLEAKFDKKKDSLRGLLKDIGMTERVVDKFLIGQDIKYCTKCETPNMYPVHIDEKRGYIMYECGNCPSSWMLDMKEL